MYAIGLPYNYTQITLMIKALTVAPVAVDSSSTLNPSERVFIITRNDTGVTLKLFQIPYQSPSYYLYSYYGASQRPTRL